MILPIKTYGDPVLRKKCKDITPDYPELKTLIDNMFETMYDAHGIGLAAPQIGLDIRLFTSFVLSSPMDTLFFPPTFIPRSRHTYFILLKPSPFSYSLIA